MLPNQLGSIFYLSSEELQILQALRYILLDTSQNILILSTAEFVACDVLVKLDVALCNTAKDLICHLWHLLALPTLEAISHQSLAYELLRELLLLLASCQTLLIALSIEVT